MNLQQLDVNLLVALDILLDEAHVTRAAERMFVTQSAMSQTLQRLREALGDPLLVKVGAKMMPTPYAQSIQGPLKQALRALESALSAPQFDPQSDEYTFRLACFDTYAVTLLPALMQRVHEAGPNLFVDVYPMDVDQLWQQFRREEVHLAIVGPRPIPADVCAVPLFRERMVCLVRNTHPLAKKRTAITLDDYISWPHMVFRITGRGTNPIDEHLAEHQRARRIVGRSPSFLSAPAVAAQSDIIVTVPGSVASVFLNHWSLVAFDPPFERDNTFAVSMAWPAHLDADPAHRWLRTQLIEIAQAFEDVI